MFQCSDLLYLAAKRVIVSTRWPGLLSPDNICFIPTSAWSGLWRAGQGGATTQHGHICPDCGGRLGGEHGQLDTSYKLQHCTIVLFKFEWSEK